VVSCIRAHITGNKNSLPPPPDLRSIHESLRGYEIINVFKSLAMLRSLPSVSRTIPALILILAATSLIAYKTLLIPYQSAIHSRCDDTELCEAVSDEEIIRPPSRQEFTSLEYKIQQLSEEVEKLRGPGSRNDNDLHDRLWESRRTQCGEGVVRNIDYQHVHTHPET
jgi:hypothetical protein